LRIGGIGIGIVVGRDDDRRFGGGRPDVPALGQPALPAAGLLGDLGAHDGIVMLTGIIIIMDTGGRTPQTRRRGINGIIGLLARRHPGLGSDDAVGGERANQGGGGGGEAHGSSWDGRRGFGGALGVGKFIAPFLLKEISNCGWFQHQHQHHST